MRLRKRDVEALLAGMDKGGAGAVDALRVALARALDQPDGRDFDDLVAQCGFPPERAAALGRHDDDALWALATELNECRQIGPAA